MSQYALARIASAIPFDTINLRNSEPTFYIKSQELGEFFELTLTKEVSVSSSSSTTSHKAQDKTVITSNVVATGNKIRYNGIISDVKKLTLTNYEYKGGKRGIAEYLETLDKQRIKGDLWDCYVDTRLNPFKNCILTNFTRTRGMSDGKLQWTVSLEFEEVRLSSAIEATLIPTPSNPDVTDGKSEQGNTSTKSAKPKPLTETLISKSLGG